MTEDEERAIEWECQKLWRHYYYLVDCKEYERAVALFTPEVDWTNSMDVVLTSRDDLLQGLHGALGDGTIRHVLTNMVVTVIDGDHASARAYNTVNYVKGVNVEEGEGPIAFEGPHRICDNYAEFAGGDQGWQISLRRSHVIFRRNPAERVGLEIWGEKAGKIDASASQEGL
jgi:hypothetical protein